MQFTAPELIAFAAIALLIARECRQLYRRYHKYRGYYRTEAWLVILVLAGSVAYYTDVLDIRKHVSSALEHAEGIVEDLMYQRPSPESMPDTGAQYDLVGRVTKVTDGDTISIKDSQGKTIKIRLHGIDTPEYNQPHGKTATAAMKRHVSGETVGVDVKDTDQYGRTVGIVYVDGVNVNLVMVCDGHAWWYERYAQSEKELKQCQEQARRKGLGLWADSNPTAPWDWRRR